MEKRVEKALIVCTPGTERELIKELQEIWPFLLSPQGVTHFDPFPEIDKFKGGIEIPCDLFKAVQFNFFLKLSTRILWRVSEFKCRDFPKLHQNLKKIPWNQWLTSKNINWEVAASASRLNNEKRIQEVAVDVFKDVKLPMNDVTHDIYIRFFNDFCTISIDLSGEALYKRVSSKKTGEAPFRETWANFVLRRLINNVPQAKLKQITLVDPFCGSGTFLFEAAYFNQPNFQRHFSFQDLNRAPKLFNTTAFSHNYKFPIHGLFKNYLGLDIEPRMIQVANENLVTHQNHYKSQVPVSFAAGDALSPKAVPQDTKWVVANPPWGLRLGQQRSFEDLVQGLAQAWRPEKLALILPSGSIDPLCISTNYELAENLSLNLGGTDVSLSIWDCKV